MVFLFSVRLKKLATILLLGILLFNWFGYRLAITYLQNQTRRQLEARLDSNDYDESQLVSIKVPIKAIAYYNATPSFERIDGSVDGIVTNPVKRHGAHAVPVKTTLADPYVLEDQKIIPPHSFVQLLTGHRYASYFPSSPASTPGRPPAMLA